MKKANFNVFATDGHTAKQPLSQNIHLTETDIITDTDSIILHTCQKVFQNTYKKLRQEEQGIDQPIMNRKELFQEAETHRDRGYFPSAVSPPH